MCVCVCVCVCMCVRVHDLNTNKYLLYVLFPLSLSPCVAAGTWDSSLSTFLWSTALMSGLGLPTATLGPTTTYTLPTFPSTRMPTWQEGELLLGNTFYFRLCLVLYIRTWVNIYMFSYKSRLGPRDELSFFCVVSWYSSLCPKMELSALIACTYLRSI